MTETLTQVERKILDAIQQDFPVCPKPFVEIGERVGCTTEEAYDAVSRLRDSGIIRRIGGSYVPAKLGYVSALIAARVDADRIEDAADCASSFPEVTHNYERQADYNLWFTVIAENEERLDYILNEIRVRDGVHDVQALPATETFKLKVEFGFDEAQDAD